MWIYEPAVEEFNFPKRCRTCGAQIVFVKTKTDKIAPLNAWFKVLRREQVGGVELAEVESSASHFATCPQAKQFSKRRKQ